MLFSFTDTSWPTIIFSNHSKDFDAMISNSFELDLFNIWWFISNQKIEDEDPEYKTSGQTTSSQPCLPRLAKDWQWAFHNFPNFFHTVYFDVDLCLTSGHSDAAMTDCTIVVYGL